MFVYGYLMTGVPLKSKHFPKFRKKFMTEFLPSKFAILQGVNKPKIPRCFPMIFVNFSEQPFFKRLLSEVTAKLTWKVFDTTSRKDYIQVQFGLQWRAISVRVRGGGVTPPPLPTHTHKHTHALIRNASHLRNSFFWERGGGGGNSHK